jgi:hypothetical protein
VGLSCFKISLKEFEEVIVLEVCALFGVVFIVFLRPGSTAHCISCCLPLWVPGQDSDLFIWPFQRVKRKV